MTSEVMKICAREYSDWNLELLIHCAISLELGAKNDKTIASRIKAKPLICGKDPIEKPGDGSTKLEKKPGAKANICSGMATP